MSSGKLLVLLDRGDYWQCGFVIPKGGFDEIKARGMQELQNSIVSFAGFLRDRVAELDDWSKIRLLTVQINRLRDWYRDGLLCIGDSAHAMSPAGGVGINLAIQDAVATANLLGEKLRTGPVSVNDLRQVQTRREWPTRVIQAMQVFIHRNLVTGQTVAAQRLIADRVSSVEMVSSSATNSRPVHRHRAEAGTLPLAEGVDLGPVHRFSMSATDYRSLDQGPFWRHQSAQCLRILLWRFHCNWSQRFPHRAERSYCSLCFGLISIRLRDGNWSAMGFKRPASWRRILLIALVAAILRILLGNFWSNR